MLENPSAPLFDDIETYSIDFYTADYQQVKSYISQISIQKRKVTIEIHRSQDSYYYESTTSKTNVTIARENNLDEFKLSINWEKALAFVSSSLSEIFTLLSPNEMHIVGLNSSGDYRQRHMSTSEVHTLRNAGNYYNCNAYSWEIFDNIILQCRPILGINVILGGLVFLCNSPISEQSTEKISTISNLTIEYSHLHVDTLPAVSWRFQKLATLKFDMCDFTGDKNRQRLMIHFPSTSIHTLVINIRPSYTYNDPYRHPELLKALSRDDSFILKIQTERNSYSNYLRRSEKLNLNDSINAMSDSLLSGTEPFIFWIKCQDLEHVIITDGDGVVVNLFKDKF